MSWLFEDEVNAYCDGVLHSLDSRLAIVPSVWPLEALNSVLVSERRRRISREKGEGFLAVLGELPIEVRPVVAIGELSKIKALARRHQLSSYDASYLFLAIQERLPLATLDLALKRAARKEHVALYRP